MEYHKNLATWREFDLHTRACDLDMRQLIRAGSQDTIFFT